MIKFEVEKNGDLIIDINKGLSLWEYDNEVEGKNDCIKVDSAGCDGIIPFKDIPATIEFLREVCNKYKISCD